MRALTARIPRALGPSARRGRAQGGRRIPRDVVLGAFAGVVIAALALAALRVETIRLRYRLAEAVREEQTLAQRYRDLTAAVRSLRDPGALRQRAASLGFGPPERVVQIDAPRSAP